MKSLVNVWEVRQDVYEGFFVASDLKEAFEFEERETLTSLKG